MRRRPAPGCVAGFLFGSTFLVVQGAVEEAGVLPFLAVRFLIGGAVLWPLARRRPSTPDELRHGVLAGLTLLAGFVLQTAGLRIAPPRPPPRSSPTCWWCWCR